MNNLKVKRFVLEALIFSALFLGALTTQAQVGIGTMTADPSAQLDVTSTKKGFLAPRMTMVQRDSIALRETPATGLLIYQTDNTPGFYYYNGSAWVAGVGQEGPAGPSATSRMAEASLPGASGTYRLVPSANNIYINAGSWISIGTNNSSGYFYVTNKDNDNTITIVDTGFGVAWPVLATVALVGRIGAAGVAGPAGPLVATNMATSGSLSFFGSSGTFTLTPSSNNVYINAGSYISIGTNNTSQYFYVSNKDGDNTITIVKESMDAGFSWPVNATVALVGPLGPYGPQGQAGIDGSDATISIGAIGTATTNGATITAGVLSLAPADESNGGIVTNVAQTFAGNKTFADSAVAKGFRATDSVTTNGFRATGTATANSFVKSGGTSSQYLMADGSTSTGSIKLNPTVLNINTSVTATADNIISGYIKSSTGDISITLPTIASVINQIGGTVTQGTSIEFTIDNISASSGAVTLVLPTGYNLAQTQFSLLYKFFFNIRAKFPPVIFRQLKMIL